MHHPHLQLASRLLCLILPSVAVFSVAQAQPSISDGSHLYAPCGTCHAPKAWGSMDGAIPNLAGQNRRYLAKQMALFRSGARIDSAMQVVATHPSIDNQHNVIALTDYLSRLDWSPRSVTGSGEHLRVGQETYTHICAACHGADGRGEAGDSVPRIAGQHYPYLRLQINVAAAFHRDLAPPEMIGALRSMGVRQKDALADYISRLGSSEVLSDSDPYDGSPR
jgi:cytochrome c553